MSDEMHSPTLGKLAKALAAAQAELADAKKDSVNPHFKNRYASLGSVRSALQATLPKHGLATVQTTSPQIDGVCVVTWLLHDSGEWLRGELYLPVAKKDAQGFGSALSYARRYALAAIVGIAADDDDDAEVAVTPPPTGPKPGPAKKPDSDVAEEALAKAFAEATSSDAIAKAEGDAARAVRAGLLTEAARSRLRQIRAAAVGRLGAQ